MKNSIYILFFILVSCEKLSLKKITKIKTETSIVNGEVYEKTTFSYNNKNLLVQIDKENFRFNSKSTPIKLEYNEKGILKKIGSFTLNYDNQKIYVTALNPDNIETEYIILEVNNDGIPYKQTYKYYDSSGKISSICECAEIQKSGKNLCLLNELKKCEWTAIRDETTNNPYSNNKELIIYNWITTGAFNDISASRLYWGYDPSFTPMLVNSSPVKYINNKNNFPTKAILSPSSGTYEIDFTY